MWCGFVQQEEEARGAIERAKQTVIDQTSADIATWKAKEEQAAKILELDEAKETEEISGKTRENLSLSDHGVQKKPGEEATDRRNVAAIQQRHGKGVTKPQKRRKRNDKLAGCA